MASRKATAPDALVDGFVTNLKNCSKVGQPGRYSGIYRRDVLAKLKVENEALHNAVVKRLGDK
jgi:hypothetical protein